MDNSKNTLNRNRRITYLFIVSLVITTAKGLRFGGSIGPGELLALMIALWFIMFYRGKIRTEIDRVTIIFWFSIIFLLLSGMFIRINFYPIANPFPRTLIAYLFSFIISYGALSSKLLTKDINQTVYAYIKITSFILFVFSVIIFFNFKTLLGLNMYWLGTSRFQGWSLDPNQFAIPFIISPFILLYYYSNTVLNKKKKATILFIITINIYVGLATDSDSLIGAWGVAFFISTILSSVIKIRSKKAIKISNVLLLLPLFSVLFMFLLFRFQDGVVFIGDFLMKDGQLSTRFNIWLRSIDIIKKSPLVGLGPDIGLDVGKSIMGESHNNILQLGMSTGVLGIITLLMYYVVILKNVIKNKDIYLLGAFAALFIFGMTHYTLRHPIYWFMLLLINGIAINGDTRGDIDE